jgi:hypothetical protein
MMSSGSIGCRPKSTSVLEDQWATSKLAARSLEHLPGEAAAVRGKEEHAGDNVLGLERAWFDLAAKHPRRRRWRDRIREDAVLGSLSSGHDHQREVGHLADGVSSKAGPRPLSSHRAPRRREDEARAVRNSVGAGGAGFRTGR